VSDVIHEKDKEGELSVDESNKEDQDKLENPTMSVV
jgi:hypothetical protein